MAKPEEHEDSVAETPTASAADATTNTTPPRVVQVAPDMLTIDGRRYQVVSEYKDAVDREALNNRYDDVLAKYDYIVGDWGYDQLRLRGFYHDDNAQAAADQTISHLEDYLYEFCNFGCAYFVIERLDAPEAKPKRKRAHRGGRGRHHRPDEEQSSQPDYRRRHQEPRKRTQSPDAGRKQHHRSSSESARPQRDQRPSGHTSRNGGQQRRHTERQSADKQHPYTERRAQTKQPQRGHNQKATTQKDQSGRRFTIRRLDDNHSK